MNNFPLVSILMTAFNRQQYIAEAIESVLDSTYQNWELIIVDDCSKDQTVEIAKRYKAKDPRINVYINEHNLGDYPNRNKAVGYSNADLIMFCDSDDFLLKDGIFKCVEVMARFPKADMGMRIFDGSKECFLINPSESIQRHFFESPLLISGPGGTILRKKFFYEIGGYPIKYGPANDMYFNLKAASKSNLVMIPFEFSNYREHEGQERNNVYSYLVNNYRYLRDALCELDLSLDQKKLSWVRKKNERRFFTNLIQYFFSTRNYRNTLEAYKMANFGVRNIFNAIFQK